MAKGAINVQITGDYSDKDIKRAIKDLESLQTQSAPTGKAFGGVSTALKGMAVAAAAFVSVGAVTDFMGDAIQQGSALQESLSKVNVVFGRSADEIVKWSESSSTAFGQSQQQALESVGTFGNLLQAFGSTQAEAQVMSQRMVELAADLASFNNTSVTDALEALRSGLSGETEPLKRFGVAINDARLKQIALEKGLYSGKGTLDVYAKSVAAYELILKDTSLAQGDFARTSDGFANQTRILSAAFDNAKASIGQGFLSAINEVNKAFGGADSMSTAIEDLGSTLGQFVGGMGVVIASLASLTPEQEKAASETKRLEGTYLSLNDVFYNSEDPLSLVGYGLYALGHNAMVAAGYVEDAKAAAYALEQGYIANSRAARGWSAEQEKLNQDTVDAEAAMKALKDQVNALKGAISERQSMDDFNKSLRDLGETLKGNERSFKGMSDAALENREVLRTEFAKAADIVQSWVESGKISADEFDAAYAKLGSKVVDRFVKQGFSRSDIRKFLQSEGMWTAEFNKVGDYAKAAGVNIGKDLLSGIKGSLADPNNLATLRYAAMQAAKAAEVAFREESQTQSPSKKWKAIGDDLIAGLVQGLDSKKDKIKSSATEAAQAVIDGANERLTQWDATIAAYKDRYDELAAYAKGISSSLFGQLDLGAAVDQAKESGGSVVDAFVKQGQAIGNFSQSMISLLNSGLSQSAWEAVNALGAARGQQLADEMLGAQGAATIAGINEVYANVDAMATAVGELAAQKWYGEGVSQAQANYEGFKANYGEGGPARKALMNLMDRLANAMNRTATITVTTINRTIRQTVDEARAAGGPVAAGKSYLVGEKGPEVLVMGSQSGTIIPNGDLPTASGGFSGSSSNGMGGGNSYNITVQAGVGDPRAIGQQVVEVIRRFESANGRVFAAA